MALDRYRDVLRTPGVVRLFATSLVARAPQGMSSLAILLLVTHRHGYGRAGLVVGLYVAATGVSNPLLARIVDRSGARLVLIPAAIAYAAAMCLLAAAENSSYLLLVATAVLAGLTVPPVVSVVRGLWSRLLDAERAQSVFALEATAQETLFIVGPTMVALLAALAGPRTAVVATGAVSLVGTVALARSPAFAERPTVVERVRQRLMRTTRLPMFVAFGFVLTVGFNMTDIGVIAFVSGRKATAAAGVVLAVWSAGSMVGGLVFGGRGAAADDRSVARGCLAIATGMGLAAVAPGRVGLALLLFAGGLVVAPALGRFYARVAAIAPEAAATETFAWIAVGLLAGSSVGAALGGLCVDTVGARATFLLAAVPPGLPALVLLVAASRQRRRALRPRPQPLAS